MGTVRTETTTPAYERIALNIREQVARGELRPGDRIPSERDMRGTWGVQKKTAAQALGLLKSWGIVRTVIGIGSVVADGADGIIPASSPTDHTARVGRGEPIYAPGERSRIYAAHRVSSDHVSADVLNALGLMEPNRKLAGEVTGVIRRARVMYRDEAETGLCTTWFPEFLVVQQPGGAEAEDRLCDFERIPGGTGRFLLDLYGFEDYTAETHRVGLRGAPTDGARELGVLPGTRMLWVLTTRWADDYVVEVDETYRFADVVF